MDLKRVVEKYPESLNSAEKLRAYLTDLYPNEKAKVGIVVSIFSCGIAEEIERSKKIDVVTIERFCTRLENDYGYSMKLTRECIDLWLGVYGKTITKPEIIVPKNTTPIKAVPPTPKTVNTSNHNTITNTTSKSSVKKITVQDNKKVTTPNINKSNNVKTPNVVNCKSKTKKSLFIKLAICLLAVFFIVEATGLISYAKYNYALNALEKGNYETAYVTFRELQKYKDSETYLSEFEVTYEKKVEIDSYGNETIVERNGKTVLADDIVVATEKGLHNAGKTITENHSSNGTDYINTYTYSKSGLLKKHITKSDTYGTVKHEITRTQKFDKNDNLIKSTEKSVEIISGDRDTSYKVTNTYKYNKYGDLIKKTEKCTGSDSETTKYKYDKYGNKTMEHPVDLSDTYKKTWKYYGIKVTYNPEKSDEA